MAKTRYVTDNQPAPQPPLETTVFNMRISTARYEELRDIAQREDRTVSSLIRRLIEIGFQQYRERAEAAGY